MKPIAMAAALALTLTAPESALAEDIEGHSVVLPSGRRQYLEAVKAMEARDFATAQRLARPCARPSRGRR